MTTRFRSWWQKVRKPLEIFVIIVVFIFMIALLVVIALAYTFNVNISGLRGKTLWDWLQLLIIPAVLAIGGYLFSFTTSRNEKKAADERNRTEREIAQDNQHETVLQEYIDKMSELLLHENLRESQSEDEVRTIARVRTLSVLHRLDILRKRNVLQFLHESKLIHGKNSIIDLDGAELSHADLKEAILHTANLSRANLSQADLSKEPTSQRRHHGCAKPQDG